MATESARRPQRQLSTLGVVALVAGGLLLHLYWTKPELRLRGNFLAQLVYFGTGLLLTLAGSWLVVNDLFPSGRYWGLGRLSRYRVKMPPEALMYVVILLALLAGALFGKSNILLLVFSLLCGPFVLNGSVTLSMLRAVAIDRGLPVHAVAGEVFTVTITVHNTKRWFASWMIVAGDVIQSEGERLTPAVLFPRIPASGSRLGAYRMRLARRGLYEFGPLDLSSQFPLGLMERSRVFNNYQELVVYPRMGRLTPLWYELSLRHRDADRRSRPSIGQFDDEFHRLREYRTGDNPRAIHWRTSARRNQLMIREFHQERDADIVLIVDLWQPERPTRRDLDRVELAVSFVATICADACRGGAGATLSLAIAGRERTQWSGAANGAGLDPLLRAMSLAKAGSAGMLKDVCVSLARETRPDCRRLLVTTRHPLASGWSAVRDAADSMETEVRGSAVEIMLADDEDLSALIEFEPLPAVAEEFQETPSESSSNDSDSTTSGKDSVGSSNAPVLVLGGSV